MTQCGAGRTHRRSAALDSMLGEIAAFVPSRLRSGSPVPFVVLGRRADTSASRDSGKNRRAFDSFRGLLSRMDEQDRKLFLLMAQKMAAETKTQGNSK
jgi:hypothetical protein